MEEKYDFALRAMVETDQSLIARHIGHIKDVIVATKNFKKTNNPEDLKNYPAIMNSHQESWNKWTLQKGKKDTVVEVHGNYACTSYATTRLLTLEGLGIGRIPLYLVENDIKEGRLIQLCPEFSIATHPLYLVYPATKYKSKRHERAKTIILEWMKNHSSAFI